MIRSGGAAPGQPTGRARTGDIVLRPSLGALRAPNTWWPFLVLTVPTSIAVPAMMTVALYYSQHASDHISWDSSIVNGKRGRRPANKGGDAACCEAGHEPRQTVADRCRNCRLSRKTTQWNEPRLAMEPPVRLRSLRRNLSSVRGRLVGSWHLSAASSLTTQLPQDQDDRSAHSIAVTNSDRPRPEG